MNGRRRPVESGLGPLTAAFHARKHYPTCPGNDWLFALPPAELITKGTGFRRPEVDRSGTPSQMDFRSSTTWSAAPPSLRVHDGCQCRISPSGMTAEPPGTPIGEVVICTFNRSTRPVTMLKPLSPALPPAQVPANWAVLQILAQSRKKKAGARQLRR